MTYAALCSLQDSFKRISTKKNKAIKNTMTLELVLTFIGMIKNIGSTAMEDDISKDDENLEHLNERLREAKAKEDWNRTKKDSKSKKDNDNDDDDDDTGIGYSYYDSSKSIQADIDNLKELMNVKSDILNILNEIVDDFEVNLEEIIDSFDSDESKDNPKDNSKDNSKGASKDNPRERTIYRRD